MRAEEAKAQEAEPVTGLYVHVPFCRHRCGYCAFAASDRSGRGESEQARYLRGLESELGRRLSRRGGVSRLSTLYVGGGTPSLLSDAGISRLFALLREFLPDISWREVTFECNPEDVLERPHLPTLLGDLGVDRISLGIQTQSPAGLRVLERCASAAANFRAASLLQSFPGAVSLDLILGWPGQTRADLLRDDLPFLDATAYRHLSVYTLNVEPGTRLGRDMERGVIPRSDPDREADVWEAWLEAAAARSLEHYEISSFGVRGHRGLHNQATWRGEAYLGIGPGAVSRVGRVRWQNFRTLTRWQAELEAGRLPVLGEEILDEGARYREELLLCLRNDQGLDLAGFGERFGFDPWERLGTKAEAWTARGWLRREGQRVWMSPGGWNYFDGLVSDWMLACERGELRRAAGP